MWPDLVVFFLMREPGLGGLARERETGPERSQRVEVKDSRSQTAENKSRFALFTLPKGRN